MGTEQRIRSMPEDITEQEFLLFRQFMLSASGVDLGLNKHALVQSRLAKRLIKLGMHNYAQYWRVMNQTESYAERQFVINALSTNETYFFVNRNILNGSVNARSSIKNKVNVHSAYGQRPVHRVKKPTASAWHCQKYSKTSNDFTFLQLISIQKC